MDNVLRWCRYLIAFFLFMTGYLLWHVAQKVQITEYDHIFIKYYPWVCLGISIYMIYLLVMRRIKQ